MSIKVGFYGVDERLAKHYTTVFRMVFKGQCVAVDMKDADTIIVELDHNNYVPEWVAFRRMHPGKPVVIMADQPISIEKHPFVAKPAKLPELLEALKKTGHAGQSHALNVSAGIKSHISADELQERIHGETGFQSDDDEAETPDGIYYHPEKFLQGRVAAAIHKANTIKKNVFVRCWSDRWLIVSPGVERLYENIKEGFLHRLSRFEVVDSYFAFYGDALTNEVIEEIAGTPIHEIKSTPIYKFMWDITVRTANGRVPYNTSLDNHYILQQWPNLTRLAHIPHAMRISAFWIDRPQSIRNVVDKLGIPSRDVFTFFSAAIATGILAPAQRGQQSKGEVQEIKKAGGKIGGVLSAIMKKLSKNRSVEDHAA